MRPSAIALALTVGLCSSCGGGGNASGPASSTGAAGAESPVISEPSSVKPTAGGTTEDFGGSAVACDDEQQLAYDETSSLGFSARQVLDMIEGTYLFPIRWIAPCEHDSECHPSASCQEEQEPVAAAFVGTTAQITIELTATGGPAIVPQPGAGQPRCATSMKIPAQMRLYSDDGAIDSTNDVEIGTFQGDKAEVHINGPASVLGGALPETLPLDTDVESAFETFDGRAALGITLLPARRGFEYIGPLLEAETLYDQECALDVPIADVLQTPQ